MNFYHVYAIIGSMVNYEHTHDHNHTGNHLHRTSKDVYVSLEQKSQINDSILSLADTLENTLIPADKSRVIYNKANCEATGAIYNLDISRSKDTVTTVDIELHGGSAAEAARYSYNAEYGLITKHTTEGGTRPVVVDELIARLATDYPDNETIAELANSPVEDTEIDFTMYLIYESLTRYGEEHGAVATNQSKYSITTVEDGPTLLPLDIGSEIIITKTPYGGHYQLDVNMPAIEGYAVRSAINYKLSAPLDSKPNSKCTALLYGTDEHSRVHGRDLVSVTPQQATHDLVYATKSLATLSQVV